MADRPLFTLTPEVVSAWEKEKADLERDIAAQQARLNGVNQKLQAAAVLTDQTNPTLTPAEFDATAGGAANENMPDAVARIANSSPHPLAPGMIKSRLKALGYPETSLANYFYTVIARLKVKGRISVTDDGKLWRAAK